MCRGEVDWRIDCLLADRLHLLHDLRSMLWLLEVHALREELRQLVLLIDIHDAFTFADNLCPSLSDTAVCCRLSGQSGKGGRDGLRRGQAYCRYVAVREQFLCIEQVCCNCKNHNSAPILASLA